MLRIKKQCLLIIFLSMGLIAGVLGFFLVSGSFWTRWDFQFLDVVYKKTLELGWTGKQAPEIFFLEITDNTYKASGGNSLDRGYLAQINRALADLEAKKSIYDIVFAYPSDPEKDAAFERSVRELGNIYLPVAFNLSESSKPFNWGRGAFFEKLKSFIHKLPKETGHPSPLYATRALSSLDPFYAGRLNSGHINLDSDPDGVYRHIPLIVKVDSGYFPSLGLAVFLDTVNIPFHKLIIHWGDSIRIPALEGSGLKKEIRIPINDKGQTYIPYFRIDEANPSRRSAHSFLNDYANDYLHDELASRFIEDRFIFISDVSQGIPDIGLTPVHDGEKPLVFAHAAVLNGLLTDTFYEEWSSLDATAWFLFFSVLLGGVAMFKNIAYLYTLGGVIVTAILGWTVMEFLENRLFPVASSLGSTLFLFSGLVIGVQVITHRDQKFIKNAFSKYVPSKVVDQILSKPEILTLGGDERVMTVLFSDIASFTAFSEKMKPTDLVSFLNEYLTEMTGIVLQEGGIIDKFEGDLIMAEFGAPLPDQDHADKAVLTGVKMQRRLRELRKDWARRGLPNLASRIGINTGPMVIGNMGSDQVFDYTVMGDSVNLASRLEGANKNYGTYLMISEFTLNHLTPNRFHVRLLDLIKVKGKSKPVKVYEVYGEGSEKLQESDSIYYQAYSTGINAYLERDFEIAVSKFKEALACRPDDLAANEMIDRINRVDKENLPEDWDGSVRLMSK